MNDNDTNRFTSIGRQCALIANRLRNRLQIEKHHNRDSEGASQKRDAGEQTRDEVALILNKRSGL